jgi:diguanylate cyclase (GGDEF)-like protein
MSLQGNSKEIEQQRSLILRTAEQLALSIANLQLRERLRNQGIRDSLTGLFNRHYMEESLEKEISQAKRHNRNVGVVMFDIDHFKNFNDSYGHLTGDFVLKEIAAYLHNNLRGGDIVCRYGGEEFLIILPGCSLADTVLRADRVCKDIRHLRMEVDSLSLPTVTASFGVAAFPEHGLNGDELIRIADNALYEAKQQGRNQVVTASVAIEMPQTKRPGAWVHSVSA